jgi:hypothetical protein
MKETNTCFKTSTSSIAEYKMPVKSADGILVKYGYCWLRKRLLPKG